MLFASVRDVGRVEENACDNEGPCGLVGYPVAPRLHPSPARSRQFRIGARRGQSIVGMSFDLRHSRLDGFNQAPQSLRTLQSGVMLLEVVKLTFGERRKSDQRRGATLRWAGGWSLASSLARLSRSRASTASAGTTSPAAACASLISRSASQSETDRFVGSLMARSIGAVRPEFQDIGSIRLQSGEGRRGGRSAGLQGQPDVDENNCIASGQLQEVFLHGAGPQTTIVPSHSVHNLRSEYQFR